MVQVGVDEVKLGDVPLQVKLLDVVLPVGPDVLDVAHVVLGGEGGVADVLEHDPGVGGDVLDALLELEERLEELIGMEDGAHFVGLPAHVHVFELQREEEEVVEFSYVELSYVELSCVELS